MSSWLYYTPPENVIPPRSLRSRKGFLKQQQVQFPSSKKHKPRKGPQKIQPDSDGFVRSLGYLWVNGRPPCDSCKGRKDCWQCDIDSKAGKTVACLACRKGKKKCSYSVHQQHLLESDSDSQENADHLADPRAQSASEKGKNKANVMAIEKQKNTVQEGEKIVAMDEEDEARVTGPFIKFKRDGGMEVVRGKGLSVEKATLGKRVVSDDESESDPEQAVRLPKQKRLRFDSSHSDVSDNNVPPSPHRYPLRSRAPQPEKTVPKSKDCWEGLFDILTDLYRAQHDNSTVLFARNSDFQKEVLGVLQTSSLQVNYVGQQTETIARALLREIESNRDELSALQAQFDMLSTRLDAVERKQKHRNTRPPRQVRK